MSMMTLNHGTEGAVSHNTTVDVSTRAALVMLYASEQPKKTQGEPQSVVDVCMDVKEAKALHAMLGHAIVMAERVEAARS